MSKDRHTRLLTAIADAGPGVAPHVGLCRASVGLLGVTSAALILMTEEESGALVEATDGVAAVVEDLQFTLGEGPCLLAFETRSAVLVPDLAGYWSRWPLFVQEATATGTQAIFALPMQIGAINLGVLYLCRNHAGSLSREQLDDAFALAEIATWMLLERQSLAGPGEIEPTLNGGWSNRAVVHQATGMLAVQLEIPLSESLMRIRSFAIADGRPIYDVAREIVGRTLRIPR